MNYIVPSRYYLHWLTKFLATPLCTGLLYVHHWYICIDTWFICYERKQLEICWVLWHGSASWGTVKLVFVRWPVDRLFSWSVSVFPKYLNLRHISQNLLPTPPMKSLKTEFRFQQINFLWHKGKANPEQALRIPAGSGSQILRPSAPESSKVISPTPGPFLPYEIFLYSFPLAAERTPRSQCGRKDYVNIKFLETQSWIEPDTFRLLAQCLNQLRHRVSHFPALVCWIPKTVVSEHHVNRRPGRSVVRRCGMAREGPERMWDPLRLLAKR